MSFKIPTLEKQALLFGEKEEYHVFIVGILKNIFI
jgi:hypothetical protein